MDFPLSFDPDLTPNRGGHPPFLTISLNSAATKVAEIRAVREILQPIGMELLTDTPLAVGLPAPEVGDETRGTIGSGLRKGRVVA